MRSVFDFLNEFRDLLRGAGIRFAITSGMACVRYGLQQTTKDSDWIVEPEDLAVLREILHSMEEQIPPAVVAYRPIFGAPLDAKWHCGGWTSHIEIRVRPNELAQHLDFFGRPPRIGKWQYDPEQGDYADRDTVARMKKTDRDRDWPMVNGLASQDVALGGDNGLLHVQSVSILRQAWNRASPAKREEAGHCRPLLRLLSGKIDDNRLEAKIRAERLVWESVNRERYHLYQREWKVFYRHWQSDPEWHWPTFEPFLAQHARLAEAAEQHLLPPDPFATEAMREQAYRNGLSRAAVLANMEMSALAEIAPPVREVLP